MPGSTSAGAEHAPKAERRRGSGHSDANAVENARYGQAESGKKIFSEARCISCLVTAYGARWTPEV